MPAGDSGHDDARRPGTPRGGAAVRARRATGRAPGEPRNVAWLYLLPGVAFFGLFTLAPLLHAGWLSFFDWDGLTPKRFVGLDNYTTAVSDPDVRAAFEHSAKLVIFYAVVPVVLGLILAGVLTRHPVRGMTFFRTALFLPQTIAGVVVAQAFVSFYQLDGPFNRFFSLIGLGSLRRGWLGDFDWALTFVGTIGTWVTFGLCMVLFIAGTQKISTSLYDAARVDGAGAVREFFAVTLPGLRNELVVAFVLTTINALRSFDLIYNSTSGGPGNETYVPALLVFQNAFRYNKVGYSCAIAVMLAIVIFAVATVINLLAERGGDG
ncbi:MAG: raffinose/stachyose/melibiose transport system permease protein [Gaiellales bacterium]|nr:raffinose/stachyose/melibiose transport system permease protein [Gaiellales bacterium]